MRLRTTFQVLIVVALGAVALAFLAKFSEHRTSNDLRIYYRAINYWRHGQGNLYDFHNPPLGLGFTYPPFAALALTPLAVLPWTVAQWAMKLATVAVALLVVYWFVDQVARRHGWTRWFTWAVAGILVSAFEPFRETLSFGQVNVLLLGLVLADFRLLIGRGSRFGGAGVGLAAAVKLTPGIFILYLLITRRTRAAVTAAATAAAATLLAFPVAPRESVLFWTGLLWNTDRVGSPAFVSNQALFGFAARVSCAHATVVWLVLVLPVGGVWAWRVRHAIRVGDGDAGVALTAVAGCLVSPITWIHHLVWLLPALPLLADRSLAARRRPTLGLAGALYVLLCSRLVWHFPDSVLLGNAYLYASLVLLVALPIQPGDAPQPHVVDAGGRTEQVGSRLEQQVAMDGPGTAAAAVG